MVECQRRESGQRPEHGFGCIVPAERRLLSPARFPKDEGEGHDGAPWVPAAGGETSHEADGHGPQPRLLVDLAHHRLLHRFARLDEPPG